MKRIVFIFLAAAVLFTSGCSSPDQWEGHVYPDKKNPLINRDLGKFESLEGCKEKAMTLLKSTNSLESGYFNCGKNCTKEGSVYQLRCEETFRGNWY